MLSENRIVDGRVRSLFGITNDMSNVGLSDTFFADLASGTLLSNFHVDSIVVDFRLLLELKNMKEPFYLG